MHGKPGGCGVLEREGRNLGETEENGSYSYERCAKSRHEASG
jgi:hypothetical protein